MLLAFTNTLILSPTKVKIGLEPVKFALQLLNMSDPVVQVISLLRPKVKFVSTLARIG